LIVLALIVLLREAERLGETVGCTL
jgi:hypothetical protein